MKRVSIFFSLIMFLSAPALTKAQDDKKENDPQISDKSKVEVYYFHYTRRCATCNAVEDVSKEAVKEFYGDQVYFGSYNLEEEKGEKKGKEIGVSGQTLIIVRGDEKINITNDGFMYARNKPDKLKKIIKGKIDPLL